MRTPVLILSVAIAALAGGCASPGATGSAAAGSPAAAPTPSASNTSGCPATLSIAAADDGSKTLCVQLGGTVTVTLAPADQKPWPLDVSGTGLTPATDTSPSAAPGPQTNTFTATSVGTADLTSEHRACPQKAGTISCNAIVVWKVTIQVK